MIHEMLKYGSMMVKSLTYEMLFIFTEWPILFSKQWNQYNYNMDEELEVQINETYAYMSCSRTMVRKFSSCLIIMSLFEYFKDWRLPSQLFSL